MNKESVNNSIVVAIGLAAIISIAVFIINENREDYMLASKAAEATDSAINQQKYIAMKKLAIQLKAKQEELSGVKKELGGAREDLASSKKKLDTIRAVVQ